MVVIAQLLSYVWLLGTPWTAAGNPGFPVLHYLLEFAQTHVHWANDAIQPSHPLSSPSPPALNLSQHEGLFQWVGFLLISIILVFFPVVSLFQYFFNSLISKTQDEKTKDLFSLMSKSGLCDALVSFQHIFYSTVLWQCSVLLRWRVCTWGNWV